MTCRHNNKLQRYNAGSARRNWDTREGKQPFRPNSNGVGYRTITVRRLLIGAINSSVDFNPTPTFLGVYFDRTLFFSKHVSFLKVKFSLVLRPYALSLLPHGDPLRSSSFFYIKIFFGPFSRMLYPDSVLS